LNATKIKLVGTSVYIIEVNCTLVIAGIIQQIYCTFLAIAFVLTEHSLWKKGKTLTTKFVNGETQWEGFGAAINIARGFGNVRNNVDASRYFRELDDV